MHKKFLSVIFAAALVFLTIAANPAQAERRADHVFIISFDGGKPAVIKQSHMPNFMKMAGEGATTWVANTIMPSITLVSHTSMLTGVSPAKHKILWNEWEPDKGIVQVPTVFQVAYKEKLSTAMFVGKPKFIHLYRAQSLSRFSYPAYECGTVASIAASYIIDKKPNLCFVHFADSDGAGHQYGWGSEQQKKAFAEEDAALGVVMNAIDKAGIADSSVVILTADHGGHDRTHGTDSPDDMNIPCVAWGKGVKRGDKITAPVTTYDTSATALWLLGVPVPEHFDGKPVTSAFR